MSDSHLVYVVILLTKVKFLTTEHIYYNLANVQTLTIIPENFHVMYEKFCVIESPQKCY